MPSAGKLNPTMVTSRHKQITKKKPSLVNQKNEFKCERCDAYYAGDTIHLLCNGEHKYSKCDETTEAGHLT